MGVDPLPGRVRGAAAGPYNHLRVVFVRRLPLLPVKEKEVDHFF